MPTLASQAQRGTWHVGERWQVAVSTTDVLPTRIPIGKFQGGAPVSPDLCMTQSTCKAPKALWSLLFCWHSSWVGKMVSMLPIQELGPPVNGSSHDASSVPNTALFCLLCTAKSADAGGPLWNPGSVPCQVTLLGLSFPICKMCNQTTFQDLGPNVPIVK